MAIGDGTGGPWSTGELTQAQQQLSSGAIDALHIEQYGGAVETRIKKTSFMQGYIPVRQLRGTDTVTNDRMGKTSLQAVVKGTRPEGGQVDFDAISLKVDTMILARHNHHLIDEFQDRYDVRKELGEDHGKEIGEFYDEAFIIQAIKAAGIASGTYKGGQDLGVGSGTQDLPDGFLGGTQITLSAVGDEADPDKLQRAIEDMCQTIEEKDVDIEGGVLLVSPAEYYTLLRNDKLVNGDFSMGNGNYAQGKVMQSNGVRIVKTNRIPKAAITDHKLSNAANSNAYNIDATEAKTKVIYLHPKSLLAASTIPLTSKVYYSDIELQWFVDSYLMFAVTANRGEYAGVVIAA